LGDRDKDRSRAPHLKSPRRFDAMQRSFQRIDQATDTIKAKGGIAAKNVRLNTLDSPWKDDDARGLQRIGHAHTAFDRHLPESLRGFLFQLNR